MTTPAVLDQPRNRLALVPILLPLVCLVWAFWTTLSELVQTWNTNPQYSHGFLVPGFAAFLLWLRRDKLALADCRAGFWDRSLGAALLAAGIVMRLAGTYWYFSSADAISLLPCVAGLVLMIGGRPAWRWAWPAVLFLAFMIPLPFRVASALSAPLQRLATVSSTYVMQTLGMPAIAEGNVILLNEHEIGIVEACSGLRMLVVFFALSTAMVLLIQRHWIDRLLILADAVPIALISNIVRVTITGVMYEAGYSELANHFFHDAAGWLMMPIALGLLWVELWVLGKLFIDVPVPPAARTRVSPARRATARTAPPRTKRQGSHARETARERPLVTADPVAEKS